MKRGRGLASLPVPTPRSFFLHTFLIVVPTIWTPGTDYNVMFCGAWTRCPRRSASVLVYTWAGSIAWLRPERLLRKLLGTILQRWSFLPKLNYSSELFFTVFEESSYSNLYSEKYSPGELKFPYFLNVNYPNARMIWLFSDITFHKWSFQTKRDFLRSQYPILDS